MNQYQLQAEKEKTQKWIDALLDVNKRKKAYALALVEKSADLDWVSGIRRMTPDDFNAWLSWL